MESYDASIQNDMDNDLDLWFVWYS